MSNIKRMKDKDGNYIFPITHEDAVLDTNGVNINDKYQQNKVLDVVLKFDLDTSGSDDCSEKINNALSYAIANNISTLYFREGVYKLNNSIVLTSDHNDIRILGAGARKTIFVSYIENIVMVDIQSGYRHRIEDVGFRGAFNVTQTAIGKTSDNSIYCARQIFKHLYFNNITYGIKLDTGYMDSPLFYDLWFQTVRGCISLKHCEGGTIQKIVAEPFVNYFVKLYQTNGMTIRDILANTNSDTYSNATDEAYSCVFIIYGSRGDSQTFGHSICIDSVHSEYIHQFAFIAASNVEINNVYIFNGYGETSQLKHTFYFAACGGVSSQNCSLNNIFMEIPLKNENIYDIFKSDFSEQSYTLSDGTIVDTPVSSIDNLRVNGFNGTVHIPYKVADNVYNNNYSIKNNNYSLVNGVLNYHGDSIPETPNAFGITTWRHGDKIIGVNDTVLYTYYKQELLTQWQPNIDSTIINSGASYVYTLTTDWTTIMINAYAKSGVSSAGSLIAIISSGKISDGHTTLNCSKLVEVDPMSITITGNEITINNRFGGHTIIQIKTL